MIKMAETELNDLEIQNEKIGAGPRGWGWVWGTLARQGLYLPGPLTVIPIEAKIR